jgi:hypothetical protein
MTVRDDQRSDAVVGRPRQNAARDELVLRRIRPPGEDAPRVGGAKAGESVELLGGRRVDVEEVAGGVGLGDGLRALGCERLGAGKRGCNKDCEGKCSEGVAHGMVGSCGA